MSYILDALRRADAERERDRSAAPGLHSQEYQRAEPDVDDDVALLPPLRVGRLLMLGMLLAGGVAALAWWLWPESTAQQVATVSQTLPVPPGATAVAPAGNVPAAPALPAASQSAALPTAAGGSAPAALPGVTALVTPALTNPLPQQTVRTQPLPSTSLVASGPALGRPGPASPGPAAVAPRPGQPPAPGAVPLPQGAPTAARPEPNPTETNPSPAAAAPVRAASAAWPKLRELSDATRKELPPLVVSGSMYSPEPGSRMLVLDGQVLREGQTAQPGLVLEQIGPKSAILSHKGQRFELPY